MEIIRACQPQAGKLGEIGGTKFISTLFHEAKLSLFPLYFLKDISTLFHEAKRSLFPLYFNLFLCS